MKLVAATALPALAALVAPGVSAAACTGGKLILNDSASMLIARFPGPDTCSLWNSAGGSADSYNNTACAITNARADAPNGDCTPDGGSGGVDAFRYEFLDRIDYTVLFPDGVQRRQPPYAWTRLLTGQTATCSGFLPRDCVITMDV
jgi:hypothetical protein